MTDPAPFRTVLGNRQFRFFLASWNAAVVGYSVYEISIVWIAYTISRSFLVVGAVLFIEFVAYALTFLVGPIIDRTHNQRTIFLACYPVQAVAAALIGIGILQHWLSVMELFILVALISILWDFAWAAGNAAPGILLTQDQQFAAQGLSGAIGGANSIAGYAIGGGLILVVGAEGGLLLYAALLGLGALFALPLMIRPDAKTGQSFSESFREGWTLVAAGEGRPLLQLAVVDALEGFFITAPPLLITLLSADHFGGSAMAYGLLFTSYIAGGVGSGILLARWDPRARMGALLAAGLLANGAALAATVLLPSILGITALAWFAVGFAWSTYLNAKYALLRGALPSQTLGRVISNMYLFPGITSSAGALVLGEFANSLPPLELGSLVALGLLSAGAAAALLPGIQRLRY